MSGQISAQAPVPSYPVHVDATLDPRLSRWLWLVKWILAVPHYVLLFFLWVAFGVLSVFAFFAILVTGRYPRPVFDFNVGVLRWTWRVAYYAYGTLGTDHYPPFTLAERPDYPAHLGIDYPDQLSRGLVLVKWWLLAIPHYVVTAFFLGGGFWATGRVVESDRAGVWSMGLIGVLVVVAAIVLLVTGRYPPSIFDLVLGMNRWVIRVAAYAALMTDQYPPFRLDQGGADPSGTLAMPPPDAGPQSSGAQVGQGAAPNPPGTRAGWTGGRVFGVVAGSLVVAVGMTSLICGGALFVGDRALRDDAGYLTSGTQELGTSTYAITSDSLRLHADGPGSFVPEDLLGRVRITADGTDGGDLFVGITAPAGSRRTWQRWPTRRWSTCAGTAAQPRRSTATRRVARRRCHRATPTSGTRPPREPASSPWCGRRRTGTGRSS